LVVGLLEGSLEGSLVGNLVGVFDGDFDGVIDGKKLGTYDEGVALGNSDGVVEEVAVG
jgi:hypothetical protein